MILTSFEQLAYSALVAVGARRPKDGARAFVAIADGFALQRLASPRGKRDTTALRDAITDLLIAQLMSDDEHEEWKQRLAKR
jgi:hypothetical protein